MAYSQAVREQTRDQLTHALIDQKGNLPEEKRKAFPRLAGTV
jgi:hypothetical protein